MFALLTGRATSFREVVFSRFDGPRLGRRDAQCCRAHCRIPRLNVCSECRVHTILRDAVGASWADWGQAQVMIPGWAGDRFFILAEFAPAGSAGIDQGASRVGKVSGRARRRLAEDRRIYGAASLRD